MAKEREIAPSTKTAVVPEPRTALRGHSAQRAMLERLTRANRLPSTMLFAGSSGIGKKRVAEELSRTLFCLSANPPYGGCGHCKHCHLVDVGNLPDCITIDCLHKDFDLDRLRALLHTLGMRPFMGGVRVVILDNAEQLSIQAANLLLKSLEEPRAGNHFILLASNPGMLPPTLLSRCQIWFFDKLTNREVEKILLEQGQVGVIEDLVQLADGSLDSIASLQEHISDWHALSSELQSIGNGEVTTAIQLASELAKNKDRLRENLGLLRIAARNQLLHSTDHDAAFRWSTCLLDLISAERLIFDRNLGANYVLSLLLSKLANHRSFTRSLHGATLLDHVVV